MDSAVRDTVTVVHYRVYLADGTPATMDDVVEAMKDVDVLFIGETHNDPVVHDLQLALMHRAYRLWQNGDGKPVALSMEMFARDAQNVLGEYLDDLISEKQFLAAGQPWDNYETDYRPLVEFAKEHKLDVIAANAPRRYANRVSRLGRASLYDLSEVARSFLAPLPYGEASEKYREQWKKAMEEARQEMMDRKIVETEHEMAMNEHAEKGVDEEQEAMLAAGGMHDTATMLDAQSLWDATMAYSIAEYQTRNPGTLVVHVVGGFHVATGTGIPEHLIEYRPSTRVLIVSVKPVEDLGAFDAESHANLGDFVILSDESLPRTFDALEQ